jgi:hypothetical protein
VELVANNGKNNLPLDTIIITVEAPPESTVTNYQCDEMGQIVGKQAEPVM